MKKILSSTIQIFKQIKSDPMMFAACFSPFIMGTLIKFGIPFLERITSFLYKRIIRFLIYYFLSWLLYCSALHLQ